jgi:photosystem II stability/assembly factor-like uncharacterized protein
MIAHRFLSRGGIMFLSKFLRISLVIFFLVFLVHTGQVWAQSGSLPAQDLAEIIKSLKMRAIGPAIMGGRTVDFAVVESNTAIIYAAVGPSGVFKSENNGVTWNPVFDRESTVAVGAVAVSQSHPDILWVGTGEGTSRNSVGIGDGVYKSEDGGRTWKNMGLNKTQHIAQILIHPTNPDIVYIGALGRLWGPNEERGVFKTADGGKTWEKALYVNPDTGISDIAMDPSNPRVLYAGAWDHRRKPYHFRSGGPGSALYKTTDAGETWRKIHQGLPPGEYGRWGIDICRTKPNVVYALVESENSGVFRSEDKGETWRRMSDWQTYDQVNFRPFYYSKITVDPNNDLVVYVYSGSSYVSRDGGKTFERISGDTHPDHHMMWVNPHNSLHLIDGNDGGIDISYDGAKTWHSVQTNAWSEVYQIGYDFRDPYYVYVGLQDNGSWGAPINSLDPMGIMNFHWYTIGGGDGFYTQVDPNDHTTLYRNAHMGGISRFDVETGDSQDIKPVAPLDEPPYRFNWNAPILLSPHNNRVVYFGSNYLFKSTDRGSAWERLGPDLSTNDPEKQKDSGGITPDNTGAEIHCTVYTIAESPLKEGVIWVGTDDGLIQLTQDGGETWTNVTANIKGLPSESWVTRIEASHFSEGTAFATFDRHRMDDNKPYLFKTEDYGRTWTPLHGGLPDVGYLHVVREDPVNRNLLYVGSEFGLFLTFDSGRKWMAYKNDFPTIAVRDIQIHPREMDLLVGTHGRGLWVLDDIVPIQNLTPEVLASDFVLFKPRDAVLYSYRGHSMYSGPHPFQGPNPPMGAMITYYLKDKPGPKDTVALTIKDSTGQTITAIRTTKEKGLNRVIWSLRMADQSDESAERSRFRRSIGGPYVLPGEYRIALEVNGTTQTQGILVKPFDKHDFTLEERELNHRYIQEIDDLNQKGNTLLQSMAELDEGLKSLSDRIRAAGIKDERLSAKMNDIRDKVDRIQKAYSRSVEGRTGYKRPVMVALRGGTLPEQISRLRYSILSYQGAPTQTQIDQFENIKQVMQPLLDMAEKLKDEDIPGLNNLLNELNFPVIKNIK